MGIKLNGLSGPFRTTLDPTEYTDSNPVESIALNISNHVVESDKYVPLTGTRAVEEDIKGWRWDRRLLESQELEQTRYNTNLGGHTEGLKDGTRLEDWQSGSISGIAYEGLTKYKFGESLTWTPLVSTGNFSMHFDQRKLFSDYSYSENFTTLNNDDGLMRLSLREDAMHSSLSVCLYERDSSLRIFCKYNFDFVEQFTGRLESGARLSTVHGDGAINASNVSDRVNEYLIQNNDVYLNGDYSISVGDFTESSVYGDVDASSIRTIYEFQGAGQESGRDCYLRYFPVEQGSLTVKTVSADNVVTTWTEVPTLDFSNPADKVFSVDYDLGVIRMGGAKAPDLFLKSNITSIDTEIEVFFDLLDFDLYPDQGVIVIDSEEIAYYSKTYKGFSDLIRGFNGTTQTGHSKGAKVQDRRHGFGTSDDIYAAYKAVPRCDYEVSSSSLRSANKRRWIDVRPSQNVRTNNVLQLLSSEINLEEVVLETSSPLIGDNLYGPVYYGSDTSRLTARGLDSRGNPVEEVPLTIEIISGSGLLNGSGKEYTDLSNTLGEVYSFYNTPYTRESVEQVVTSVTYDGPDTKITVSNLPEIASVDDIWIFQILKHDPVTGTVGTPFTITDAQSAVDPYGSGYIDVDGLISEDYVGGFMYIYATDGVRYRRGITFISQEEDGFGVAFSRVYIDVEITSALATGQEAYLYVEGATEWNSALLNGTRNILYQYRSDVEHPLTGEPGAYYPVHPTSVEGNVLTFSNLTLPAPSPADDSSNLGGYAIIASGVSYIQARGRDPISSRVIESNVIRLSLELPAFLAGVDKSGALPIPYGWKLVTDDFNIGSGIGGANFLTINPVAEGINQISITGTI